jgi:O-antigen ligase
MPFDLTAAAAVLLVLTSTISLLTRRLQVLRGVGPAMVLITAFLPGVFITATGTYAHDKLLHLFTLTLGCALLGSVIILSANRARLYGLLISTVAVGGLISVMYRLAPSTQENLEGRLALEGSNTIAIGRFTGAALLALVMLMMARRMRLIYAVPLSVVFLYLMIASGSRGPVLAVVVSGILVLFLQRGRRTLIRMLLVLTAVAAGGYWAFQRASPLARERFLQLLQGDRSGTINERLYLLSRAWEIVESHFFGLGWGGLAPYMYPISVYPHNIVLEITGEAGWVALGAFVAVTLVAIRRVMANLDDPVAVGILALLAYWLVNAMVSGDLNDNRGVFIMLAACWSLGAGPSNDRQGLPELGRSWMRTKRASWHGPMQSHKLGFGVLHPPTATPSLSRSRRLPWLKPRGLRMKLWAYPVGQAAKFMSSSARKGTSIGLAGGPKVPRPASSGQAAAQAAWISDGDQLTTLSNCGSWVRRTRISDSDRPPS